MIARRLKTAALAFGALMTLVAACDNSRPPVSSGLTNPAGDTQGGTSLGSVDASTALPGCGQQDNGSYCDCVDTPLFTDPPNMYFLLDRSGSMADQDKWGTVRDVVANITRGVGERANFGATVFPGFSAQESCDAPVEVMSLRPGDPPSASASTNGPVTNALLSATSADPYGGTPTAAALTYVRSKLMTVTGKTFVILATDGGPNCNDSTPCGVALCQPNIEADDGCPVGGPTNCCAPPEGTYEACLDSTATIDAVNALKEGGIPVYVVGLPGTATYSSLLNTLATAGGTAQTAGPTQFYSVATASETDLLAALKTIAAKITATCTFQLKSAPADPTKVNVYFDEQVLPADPVNGWSIAGDTVTLLGTACSQVLAGDVLDVRIIVGCPTVEPK